MDEQPDDVGGAPRSDGVEAPDEDIQEQIAQIAETRAEMADTIDAIQERLSPEALKQQAADTVHDATIGEAERIIWDAREQAGRVTSAAAATVQRNRTTTAIAGGAIAVAALVVIWRAQRGTRKPAPEATGVSITDQLRPLAARLTGRNVPPARETPWERVQRITGNVLGT